MKVSEASKRLEAMIKKAIEDGKITTSEYETILALANQDLVIDPQEKKLLAQLQDMLADKTVVRVPD